LPKYEDKDSWNDEKAYTDKDTDAPQDAGCKQHMDIAK
jgi:hypothetical protein